MIGGDADLERALHTVVLEEAGSEDLGEFTGGVAADGVHLEEAIPCGEEALSEDEVVHRGGADGGDAVLIAQNGNGSVEAGDGEAALELRESFFHGTSRPEAAGYKGCGEKDAECDDGDTREADEPARDGEIQAGWGIMDGVASPLVAGQGEEVLGRLRCHYFEFRPREA